MVIIGSDPTAIASLKQQLQTEFEMKNPDFLCYFFIIEVANSSHGYLLSQHKYIFWSPCHATLNDAEASFFVSTLMEFHLKLGRSDDTPLPQHTWYLELVHSLIYLRFTRPDIYRVVHVLSQFIHALTFVYYVALPGVLFYLQNTNSRS